MRRVRYQFGCLRLKKDFWTFRFYETGSDGKRHYRQIRVGTKAQYSTRTEAMKALEGLRLSINTGSFQMTPVCFGAVIQRYLMEELPGRFSTRACYTSMRKRCIETKWSEVPVNDIRTLEVEHWLKSLTSAPKTKANVRNFMHLLFEFARRWDLADKNPIELVRQSSRRQRIPKRLSVEEFQRLLGCLSEPCRTTAVLAACLGLRIGGYGVEMGRCRSPQRKPTDSPVGVSISRRPRKDPPFGGGFSFSARDRLGFACLAIPSGLAERGGLGVCL